MRDLTIETFQVVLVDQALGLADPGLVVLGPTYRTSSAAAEGRAAYDRQARAGAFDPVTVAGRTFAVRATPGAQRVSVPDTTLTRDDLLGALGSEDASVPLYVKMAPGADIRMTTMTLGDLRARGA